jgi:uncharacterized membrane protein AbrB (regulator of aidB expression)
VTQYLPGTAGAMAGAVTAVIAETVGVAAPLDIGLAIVAGVVAMVAYAASPLPNTNGAPL